MDICHISPPFNRHNLPTISGISQVVLAVKIPSASAGDIRDVGSIPGPGRSPGGGHGSPLQYSCLEDPMDREAWWATDCGITKSRTRLKRLSTHSCIHPNINSSRPRGVCATVLNLLLLGPLAEEQEGIHLVDCQLS